MSLMITSRASPLARTVSTNSRCSPASSVSSSRPVIPITAFIGVRISWLMVARKADLAAVAASASRRARSASTRSCTAARLICLISLSMARKTTAAAVTVSRRPAYQPKLKR